MTTGASQLSATPSGDLRSWRVWAWSSYSRYDPNPDPDPDPNPNPNPPILTSPLQTGPCWSWATWGC